MNNKNWFAIGTFLVLFLLLVGGYYATKDFTEKMDLFNSRLSALETSNKMLASTCTAPVREPASLPAPAPKKLLRDDIYRIVFSHKKELNACYELRKNKKADLRRMIVSLAIKNSGEVVDARTVNSDIKNKKVEDCVTSMIKKIDFPTFDGDLYKDEIYISFDSRSLI
jgi:hypothetical protein